MHLNFVHWLWKPAGSDDSIGLCVIDIEHAVKVVDFVLQQGGGSAPCIEDIFPVVQSPVSDLYIIGALNRLAAMPGQGHAVLFADIGSFFSRISGLTIARTSP